MARLESEGEAHAMQIEETSSRAAQRAEEIERALAHSQQATHEKQQAELGQLRQQLVSVCVLVCSSGIFRVPWVHVVRNPYYKLVRRDEVDMRIIPEPYCPVWLISSPASTRVSSQPIPIPQCD